MSCCEADQPMIQKEILITHHHLSLDKRGHFLYFCAC